MRVPPNTWMRIAIIGGGIGGLTAALALKEFGFEAQIFEQAPQLLEVGAAILMWPNAMRVLHRLGVADTIREHGAVLEKARWLKHDGKPLNNFSLPETEIPAVALHRADLQQTLLHALPSASVHLNHIFQSYEQRPEGIIAHFQDAAAVECDVLIAADGLHSRAREQLLHDGAPIEHSYAAWRGVMPHTPKSVALATATEIYGRGRRFGIGPLGHGRVGWWASANKSLLTDTRASSTQASPADHESMRAELLRLFAGWCDPVRELISDTPSNALVRNPVCDRLPVRRWGEGCMTMLGDAVHPITPNLGQGGCLAIEDAAVLARCFEKYATKTTIAGTRAAVRDAWRRFESVRYSRSAWVFRCSRIYGRVGQWETGIAVQLRNRALSLVPTGLTKKFLRRVFDYDAYGRGI
jgi:2-polyprenyl-6-methoxyphenol hydroxylase-like FAD-dependent oxidoreductase